MDTWRRHCYWGPSGCKDELPDGQPEWYWSLLEFGVKLKRHAPYFGLTVIMPTLITCLLTLCSFWIDTSTVSISLLIFNVLLQGLFGWDLIRELPPGSGNVPKIVTLYGFNLSLTTLAFIIHVLIQYFETILPSELELPFQVTSLSEKLKLFHLFQAKGLSFDPQLMLNADDIEDPKFNSILSTVGSSTALDLDVSEENVESTNPEETITTEEFGLSTLILSQSATTPELAPPTTKEDTLPKEMTKTMYSLYILRRILFCFYFVLYMIMVPLCLF